VLCWTSFPGITRLPCLLLRTMLPLNYFLLKRLRFTLFPFKMSWFSWIFFIVAISVCVADENSIISSWKQHADVLKNLPLDPRSKRKYIKSFIPAFSYSYFSFLQLSMSHLICTFDQYMISMIRT